MFPKPKRWKSKKWTDAAKGQPCTMCLVGCNNNPETTIFAHANGAGMAMKADDFNGADMCSNCHDIYDGRVKSKYSREELRMHFEAARLETIRNRLERKVVK